MAGLGKDGEQEAKYKSTQFADGIIPLANERKVK